MLGAGGGVGLAAVQLGVAAGRRRHRGRVVGRKARRGSAYTGRQHLINHRSGDLRAALRDALPDGADAVIDPVGGDLSEPALRSLRRGGRFVTVGYASGVIPRIPLNLVLVKGVHVLGLPVPGRCPPTSSPATRTNCATCSSLARVTPHIGAVYPLAETVARTAAGRRRASHRQGADRPQRGAVGSARRNEIRGDRRRRHHAAAERLGRRRPSRRRIGGRQRLGLERAGGGAELVRARSRRCSSSSAGQCSPHSVTSVRPCSSAPSTPRRTRVVAGEQVGGDGDASAGAGRSAHDASADSRSDVSTPRICSGRSSSSIGRPAR